jgi:signal transduction histidine kinase
LVAALSGEYEVAAAADGKSALLVAEEHRPRVVLLDLMLPDMDGVQVCRELRRSGHGDDLKILMLTAQMDEGVKIEALESGVDDFLTKPFSTVEVKTRIRNLLAAAVLQQDLRQRNRELEEAMVRLKATEAQLIQSEKMNAIGSLASGLLHEINNPLNYITMAVALAKRGVAQGDDKMAKRIADIEDGIKRIAEVISSLRDFAYPETAAYQRPFSLSQAVSTALRFTAFDLKDVKLETPDAHADVQVLGSRVHVTQILVNLLTNAARAVNPVRDQREARVKLSTEAREGRIFVKVWDNGVGMKPDVMERIFEPFYTTRDVGQGTGLGLSVCHTLVRNHGGQIQVHSQPGEWSEFAFDLPVAV